jgi:hypothetical protein
MCRRYARSVILRTPAHVLVKGSALFLWYFDREGPIKTDGFCIVEGLPLYALFLFVLQRFRPEHWGFNSLLIKNTFENYNMELELAKPDLPAKAIDELPGPITSGNGAESTLFNRLSHDSQTTMVTVQLHLDPIDHYKHYLGLVGRFTVVVPADMRESASLVSGDPPRPAEKKSCVAKISIPHAQRRREVETLQIIMRLRVLAKDKDVRGHVPIVLASNRCIDNATNLIRDFMDLSSNPRVLSILVFPTLCPIRQLTRGGVHYSFLGLRQM